MFLAEENCGRLVIESLASHQRSKLAVSLGPALLKVAGQKWLVEVRAAIFC